MKYIVKYDVYFFLFHLLTDLWSFKSIHLLEYKISLKCVYFTDFISVIENAI